MTGKKIKPKASEVDILIRGVRESVRDAFKARCASLGTNMTAEIKRFMKESVNKDK